MGWRRSQEVLFLIAVAPEFSQKLLVPLSYSFQTNGLQIRLVSGDTLCGVNECSVEGSLQMIRLTSSTSFVAGDDRMAQERHLMN